MACQTCKSKSDVNKTQNIPVSTSNNYILKFLVFLIASVILIPFIIPILLVVLFRVIVLAKNVDISPLLMHMGRKIFPKDQDEAEEYDELDQDEYELEDPNDIIIIHKN